jgi:hypothetical protein
MIRNAVLDESTATVDERTALVDQIRTAFLA